MPGGLAAGTTRVGPYAHLPLAYHAFFASLHEHGLCPGAPVRETCLVGPAEAPPGEWVTRVTVPLLEDAA
ncbi:GyrI-like domain-containing protein [Streptomyces triticirhizae]|uniref:GyrI-like domain-containing protein n=1 Tax=Streptomyces triticirhizae TaxID=2483353 RepID=UPI001F4462C1|nr:GyrI-like domain-containing protein [Streptomyces triticirhizae]